jgi:NADPH:quinone reductase-like Zn-dependent oxidoreductase
MPPIDDLDERDQHRDVNGFRSDLRKKVSNVESRYIFAPRAGGPEVLEVRKRPVESPKPHEAVVRVQTSGVSGGDPLFRAGAVPVGPKPPFTPGFDITGIVESVGDEVTGLEPGQQVTALVKGGGNTEHIALPADRLIPVPDGLDPVLVAASTLNYFIAHQMLHRIAELNPGQRIVVHAAAGGVGIAVLQLARLAGIESFATCSGGKRDSVTELGARHIDYQKENFVDVIRAEAKDGLDAALDPIGGTNFRRSYRLLRRGGVLIGYGQSQVMKDGKVRKTLGAVGLLTGILGPKLVPDGRRTTFYNAWSLEKSHPQAYRDDMIEVLRLLKDGKITPVIAEAMPLADAAKAHEILERASIVGKIVLVCDPSR